MTLLQPQEEVAAQEQRTLMGARSSRASALPLLLVSARGDARATVARDVRMRVVNRILSDVIWGRSVGFGCVVDVVER